MSKSPLAIIILAAGKGTRMKSAKPKVMHEIGGLPMISHVIRTAEKLKPRKIVVVVGPGMEEVTRTVKPHATVIQKNQKGTGDAVKAAMPALKNFKSGDVLVLNGDGPLVQAEDLKLLLKTRHGKKAGLCIVAMYPDNPGSYGRVVLNKDGSLKKIVEAKDATKAEKEIALCYAGIVCADAKNLGSWIEKIKNNNAKNEYYITDLPEIAAKSGVKTAVIGVDADSVCGINNREDLAFAESLFQNRRRLEMLTNGVTLIDPHTAYFAWDTAIAADVTIQPNVFFGPGVRVESGAVIKSFSHIEGTVIGKNVSVGPFARLRPGSIIGDRARIGNFVEIKKSTIGRGSKVNHLAYVGDTDMGDDSNFSAGAITVNFDGFDKHRTKIGRNVMIGSNVNLIAPVTVNDGAFVAAGATVTEDVPVNALSIGRSQPKLRKGWAAEFRKKKAKK